MVEPSSYVVCVSGPLVVALWSGEVTPAAVREVGEVLSRTAQESDVPIAFLTVAQFRAPVPSAEVRHAILDAYGRLGPRLACVAQVVEGQGFWAAAARSFIAGIGLLAWRQWPMSVFAGVPDALQWIEGHSEIDRVALADRIPELRIAG